jgi:hypothetical protein
MKITKPIFVLLILISICTRLSAARFWVSATTSNWNNTANWSASSGGPGGASVPAATDDVNFDANGIGNCSIDAAVNVKSILVASGYSGTILQGTSAITALNAASFSGGIFNGGSANITIKGVFTISGTNFTSTSAILELQNDAAFSSGGFIHNNGTVRFNSSIASETISGTSPVFYILEFVGLNRNYTISALPDITVANNLIFSGSGFFNLIGGTIDVQNDITVSNSATGCGGTTMITINGTGAQRFIGNTAAGTGAIPQLTINKTSGTLTLSNFPAVSNNFTYTAGTVAAGTSTFCFTHGNTGAYSINGSLSLAGIEFIMNTSLSTISIAGTLTATGDLTVAGAGGVILNTGNINVNGNISLSNTANNGGGSATINIVGTGAQIIDGSTLAVNQSRLPLLNINKILGSLSLTGNISASANVSYTSGLVNPGTSTLYIVNNLTMTGNLNLYNLTVAAGGNTTVTIASGTTVNVSNNLDLENGANYIQLNTGTIAVQGNIIDNNTGTSGGGNATILINGTGAQSISSTGIIDQGRLPGITISKLSGTLTLPSLITVTGNWTYALGAMDVTTNNSTVVFENTLTLTGTHSLNHVVFNGAGNYTFTTAAGSVLTIQGNMTIMGANNVVLNSGNINLLGNLSLTNTSIGGGGSTVLSFVSATSQSIISTLAINQSSLPAVTINKTGGTLSFPAQITVRGNWTYLAGTYDVTTNNSTIVFAGPLIGGLSMTGSHTLNNVTLEGNNNNVITVNTGTVLTVTGTLTTIGTNNVFVNTPILGSTAIQAQGNILISNTSLAGGGTGLILINGSGTQNFTSTTTAGLGQLPYVTIQKPSGSLNMTGVFSVTRDWVYLSGTVDATSNATTVDFGWDNLIISSAGMNFYHVLINSNTITLGNSLTVKGNLTINGTGVLAAGGNNINLAGNWTNRGTAGFTEATSSVNFNGSSLQIVSSTGGENFTNVTVNNAGAGIQLVNTVAVATSLTLTQGNIDLNSNGLTLGVSALAPGTLNYTAGMLINNGSFTRWFAKSTIGSGGVAGLFPMGTGSNYRPFSVAIPMAPTTGGTISVSYTDASTNTNTSFADGSDMILLRKDLNWAVSTATLAGGSYNLNISGAGYGLIGNVTDLRLVLASAVTGTPGTNAGTLFNPQVNRTGLTQANLNNSFYLGSINSTNTPLPITLISFTAVAENKQVKLSWQTAAEVNNDHFTVLRSEDAVHWQDLISIPGSGNTSTISSYTAVDGNPYAGLAYYRLGQTDRDGKESFSQIRTVDMTAINSLRIYPNPTVSLVYISGVGSGPFSLFNNYGQEIKVPLHTTATGTSLDLSRLPAGIYYIRWSQQGVVSTKAVVKE